MRAPRGWAGLLVVTLVATAFSEAFYWYAGGTDFPVRFLFYLVPTTALLWVASRLAVAGWQSIVLAGAVYGFVTEGVLTPVMYGAFPFDPFALSYTSLAWHALVTVCFGLIGLHHLLVRARVLTACAGVAAFGVFWGAWAVTLALPDGPTEPSEGIAAFTGEVPVDRFALYTAAVTAVVALGHLALGRVVHAEDLVPGRRLTRVVLMLGALYFAVAISWVVPWSLPVLLAMLWVCRAGLRRAAAVAAPAESVLVRLAERVPLTRLPVLLLLPAAAVATYAAIGGAHLSEAVTRGLFLDAVVGLQWLAGWVALVAALVSIRRRRGVVGYSVVVPRATTTAGPVSSTRSSAVQVTVSVPPGTSTR